MNKRIKFIMPILCGVLLSSSLAFTNDTFSSNWDLS